MGLLVLLIVACGAEESNESAKGDSVEVGSANTQDGESSGKEAESEDGTANEEENLELVLPEGFPEHIPMPEDDDISRVRTSNSSDTFMEGHMTYEIEVTVEGGREKYEELTELYVNFMNDNNYEIETENVAMLTTVLYFMNDDEKISVFMNLSEQRETTKFRMFVYIPF